MKNKIDKSILDAMHKDPANWFGIFYINKKDPRVIVPKKLPWFGVTINFGSVYSYVILIVLALSIFIFNKVI